MFDFGCDGIEDPIQLPLLRDATDGISFDSNILGDGGSGRERGAGSYGSNDVANSIPEMAKFLSLFFLLYQKMTYCCLCLYVMIGKI